MRLSWGLGRRFEIISIDSLLLWTWGRGGAGGGSEARREARRGGKGVGKGAKESDCGVQDK